MAYEDINFTPPDGVREEAARGLEWRREYGRGGTEVGVARARDLSNGTTISPDTARRMKAYFDRHEIDKEGEGWSQSQDGYPSAGRIAWALWGGDPGRSWAEKLVRQMNAEDERRTKAMELERRCLDFDELPEAELTIEERANGTQVITGYAAVYNRFSLPLREGGSAFREIIRPGAFDRILNRQRGRQDVVALLNHDSNLILGRTSSGTLELSSDEKGLRYTVTPPDTQVGRDTLELVRRRDLRGSSFAFAVDAKGEQWSSDEQGPVREIRDVSLLADVSVVLTPAYPASSAAVAQRSYEAWLASHETLKEEQPLPTLVRGVANAWAAVLRMRSV
jgi:hypothetical protein